MSTSSTTYYRFLLSALLLVLACGCKSEKKYIRYADIYSEQPAVVYLMPVADKSEQKETADSAMLARYAQHDVAADHLFASLPVSLKDKGYRVLGDSSATQIEQLDRLPRRKVDADVLKKYRASHGVDAVLITTLYRWDEKKNEPTAYVEFQLRSTSSGKDLAHVCARVSREIDTTYKGKQLPLVAEQLLADTLHVDIESAMRCYMLQQAAIHILSDLPFQSSKYLYMRDQYMPAIEEYIKVVITIDGFLEVRKSSMEEYENAVFI